MNLPGVADYYDRHWARRMKDEPSVSNASWRDLGALRLLGACGPHHRILDVGCGIGHTIQHLIDLPGAEVLMGIDPSAAAAEEARRRVPHADIRQGVAEDMSIIPDACCDAVTALAVMEHVYDTHRALNEFNRVLKMGGHVAIYTTDFNWLKKVLVAMFAFERCFDVCGGHIRYYTRRSLRDTMAEHGFEMVRHEWDTTYWGIMPQGQNALFRKVRDERVLRETV